MKQNLLIDLHFLPNVEYFCALLRHDVITLEGQESYVKGSFRNKAQIVTANGMQLLSIPLKRGKHQQKNIQAVEISYQENWQRQHWRSIKTAYQNAPFYEEYEGSLSSLLSFDTSTLWDYNLHILRGLLEIFQIECNIEVTKTYQKVATETVDLRHRIIPKNQDWSFPTMQTIPYTQVFDDRQAFIPNASIIDLMFCKGPESILLLEKMNHLMTST